MEENNKLISTSDLCKGLAQAAIQALLDSRGGLKLKDFKPEVAHFNKISQAIARLEKEKKLEKFNILSSRINLSFNDKNFQKLSELARIESINFITYQDDSVDADLCSEEIIYNYFINIHIPENLFGFSKEFFLSLLFALVLYYFSGRKADKDKEEILKAIEDIKNE